MQTAGDCLLSVCDGSGNTVQSNDDTDLPDDNNPCTNDICTAGVGSHTLVAFSTACGQALICDGMGACVGCVTAADCPGTDDECKTRSCVAGTCGVVFTAVGTPVTSQIAGDCLQSVCDGSGTLQDIPDDADLPSDDGNACTDDLCGSGAVIHPAKMDGSLCDDGDLCTVLDSCQAGSCMAGGPMVCNALDGCHTPGVCDPQSGMCTNPAAADGTTCDDNNLCSQMSTCVAGICTGSDPVVCTALDQCHNAGTCDPATGVCSTPLVPDGTACNDSNTCTVGEVCTAGVCADPIYPLGYIFFDDFSDNSAGWTLDTNWSIGAAVAGCGDPGTDHTSTADNGIAGVVIGGCAPTTVNAVFSCLTSPVVDASALPTVYVSYWRDLWSDYTPYMKNKVEVWNGTAWVIVSETFGAPEVNDTGWTSFSHDITAHKNAAMRVRWCYAVQAAGAFNRGSWNLDDVTIGAASCTP